jgi:hypothetical protein
MVTVLIVVGVVVFLVGFAWLWRWSAPTNRPEQSLGSDNVSDPHHEVSSPQDRGFPTLPPGGGY